MTLDEAIQGKNTVLDGKVVLVVDDDSALRNLLPTFLGKRYEGAVIEGAASGEDALTKLSAGALARPDLLLTDRNMGKMKGEELIREIREMYNGHKIHAILITSDACKDIARKAKAGYLHKPYSPQGIYRAIEDELQEPV